MIHRQVSSMRPPMFQNQPSPPAMAHAMSASPDSTAHAIARRMSSSSSPTVPNQFPSAAPCAASGTSTKFATYEACRARAAAASPDRSSCSRPYCASVWSRRKSTAPADLRCRDQRLVDQPSQQLGDFVLLDRLVGADRFGRRYPEGSRKERKGARTPGVRRRTAGRSSSRSPRAASAGAGTRYVLRRSRGETGRRACSRGRRARTRASGPRRARSRAEGNRGVHRARGRPCAPHGSPRTKVQWRVRAP